MALLELKGISKHFGAIEALAGHLAWGPPLGFLAAYSLARLKFFGSRTLATAQAIIRHRP